jgi:hypothetical protein
LKGGIFSQKWEKNEAAMGDSLKSGFCACKGR